ncbi:MAG: restriction endonuclease subunit S [Saprospiraceae bacterium]|nr:restriction endonuclease subunit S [Candidatus Vicinibacter proximus]
MVPIKLEGLIDFKNGKIASKKLGTIPIYGGNGILGYTDESNYENVLIIGRVGAYCGSVHIEKGKCWVSDNAIAGVHKQIESNEYNYYLLKCISLNKKQIGSSQPLLTQGILNRIDVNIYSDVSTRAKIASVLSTIDSKIELNNRINAELETMAKTLYDYWFVQFDFPDKNGKPYKTSGGKMVWNEELKKEIPEGWEVKFLRTEIEIQRGISYTSKEINGDGIPMINLNSFNLDGTYKSEGVKTYSGKFTEKNIVKSGDLLIAATDVTRNADIIGRAILVPDYYKEELVFSMDIAKIISKNIPSSFLMMLFNSNHYHNYIKWYASGTIVLHLNLDGVNRYQTELPPTILMKQFDDFYLPIANRIYMTAKENEKLSGLRDWLLPMLMNGQVKIN